MSEPGAEVVIHLRRPDQVSRTECGCLTVAIPGRVSDLLAKVNCRYCLTGVWSLYVLGRSTPARPGRPGRHEDWCEAELDHVLDCGSATELCRLRSFAEAVRDEFECSAPEAEVADAEHVTDCWQHAAIDALERPGRLPGARGDG
jgi:hypothetical protein